MPHVVINFVFSNISVTIAMMEFALLRGHISDLGFTYIIIVISVNCPIIPTNVDIYAPCSTQSWNVRLRNACATCRYPEFAFPVA